MRIRVATRSIIACTIVLAACADEIQLSIPHNEDDLILVQVGGSKGEVIVAEATDSISVPGGADPRIGVVSHRQLRGACFRDLAEAADASYVVTVGGEKRAAVDSLAVAWRGATPDGRAQGGEVDVASDPVRAARRLQGTVAMEMAHGRWCMVDRVGQLWCGRLRGQWLARALLPGKRVGKLAMGESGLARSNRRSESSVGGGVILMEHRARRFLTMS